MEYFTVSTQTIKTFTRANGLIRGFEFTKMDTKQYTI